MEEIVLELKEQIIDVLNLEDLTPEEIDVTAPLFGDGGIGLDRTRPPPRRGCRRSGPSGARKSAWPGVPESGGH